MGAGSGSKRKGLKMFLIKDNKIIPARVKVSSSPSYTLADLRRLTKQFLDDMQHRGHVTTYGPDSLIDWKFETFLQWLAKVEKEREGNERST